MGDGSEVEWEKFSWDFAVEKFFAGASGLVLARADTQICDVEGRGAVSIIIIVCNSTKSFTA